MGRHGLVFAHVCLCHPAGRLNQRVREAGGGCQLRRAARADMPRLTVEQKKPARCVADAGKDWTMADHPVKVVGMIEATLGEAAAIVYWTPWRVL
jgi:hypothetical protein